MNSIKTTWRGLSVVVALFAMVLMLAGCGTQGGTDAVITVPVGGAPGTATLSWDTPLKNTDGSLFTDLKGFKVYYGVSSKNYTNMIDVGKVNQYSITGLRSGTTYYFTVTTYNTSGIESNYATEDSKTIL